METMAFGTLTVRFDHRVIRPRPWTLEQSRFAATLAADLPDGPILELCAGVGHIGLHVALTLGRDLTQIDADPIACEHARHNATTANLNVHIDVRHGRIDTAVKPHERFALILADPPWVPTADTAHYPSDPLTAIDGGHDGLDLARTCLHVMDRHLAPAGAGVLQVGTTHQAAQLDTYLQTHTALKLRLVAVRTIPNVNGVLTHLAR